MNAKETQQVNARRIIHAMDKTRPKGMSKVEVEMEDRSLRKVTDPEEMNKLFAD